MDRCLRRLGHAYVEVMGITTLGMVLSSLLMLGWSSNLAPAQEAARQPGRFFTIEGTDGRIDLEAVERLRAAIDPYLKQQSSVGVDPILVFVLKTSESKFGASLELAEFLANDIPTARTVAFIPEPLSGFDVLPALSCGEIVLGPQASIGPISPPSDPGYRPSEYQIAFVRELARRFGRDEDLLLGMLQPSRDLRKISTPSVQRDYVFADDLKDQQVRTNVPAWEGGVRGRLTAEQAREVALANRLIETRADVAMLYDLPVSAINEDPTLTSDPRPLRIEVQGWLDRGRQLAIERDIAEAKQGGKVNLIIFDIDSVGGPLLSVESVARAVSEVDSEQIRTVAYIHTRALGVASLIPLACDQILIANDGQFGSYVEQQFGEQPDPLDPNQIGPVSDLAAEFARAKGHPEDVARAMFDPSLELVQAKDTRTGGVVIIQKATAENPEAEGRYQVRRQVKEAGEALTVQSAEASQLGLVTDVVDSDSEDALKEVLGLRGVVIPVTGPNWVDGVVAALNAPGVAWFLLFLGIFLLILELKLPGIGLPAIGSITCFGLFFWSRYLSGTADSLEILLFLIGMVCLAIEIFVLPGFGVFGGSGIVLVLVSVVMASHTFIWPSNSSEYQQMSMTVLQLVGVIVLVSVLAVALGKYLPGIPLLNRLVLRPESVYDDLDEDGKPSPNSAINYAFLLGETGRTTTVCKPFGRAMFGDLLVEVSADGAYIEADKLVEVIEAQGSRVIVRLMDR